MTGTNFDYGMVREPETLECVKNIDTAMNKLTALSAAELAYLDGVTAGTSAASKAVVLSAAGKIDTIDITTPKINGTTVSQITYAASVTAANSSAVSAAAAVSVTAAAATSTSTTALLADDLKAKVNLLVTLANEQTAKIALLVTEANDCKAKFNAELTQIKASGLQASST